MANKRTYELYLLFQMQGKQKVAETLASLGVSVEGMNAAAHQIGNELGFNSVGHNIALYFQVLGNPIETTEESGIELESGFYGSLRHRFHLSLWPDMEFIVRSHPDGWVWKPEFMRRPGSEAPFVSALEDVEPWSLVESEIREHFGAFSSEYAFNFSKDGIYLVERAGARVELSAMFDFELFQGLRTERA